MAQFIRAGDRGINLDHVLSWHYDLPQPTCEAQITLRLADGRGEQFTGLSADALAWHLEGLAADLERCYVAHWTGEATAQMQRRHVDDWRAAQYEREQAAADAHDTRIMRKYLNETM